MGGSVKLEKCCIRNFGSYVKESRYYDELRLLAIHLQSLRTKDYHTKNPYRRLAMKIALPSYLSSEKALELFDSLVHELTVLNRMYRVQVGSNYQSCREDVLNVLQLMRPLVFPASTLNENTKRVYMLLEDYYGYQERFSSLESRIKLRVSRSSMKRYLQSLEQAGLVKKVGGDRKRGYQYQLEERKV